MTRKEKLITDISKRYNENFSRIEKYWFKHRKYDRDIFGRNIGTSIRIIHPKGDSSYYDSLLDNEAKLHREGMEAKYGGVGSEYNHCFAVKCTAVKRNNGEHRMRQIIQRTCDELTKKRMCPLIKQCLVVEKIDEKISATICSRNRKLI